MIGWGGGGAVEMRRRNEGFRGGVLGLRRCMCFDVDTIDLIFEFFLARQNRNQLLESQLTRTDSMNQLLKSQVQ